MKEFMPRWQQLPIDQVFNEVGAELARKCRSGPGPQTATYRLSETGLVLAEPMVILLVRQALERVHWATHSRERRAFMCPAAWSPRRVGYSMPMQRLETRL